MTSAFAVGDLAWYEVAKKDHDDWRIPAVVVGLTRSRIIIEFAHWSDGHSVQRAVRPHRLTPRRVRYAD